MSDDPDLEDLKAQTSQGDRLDSAAKEMDRQDLVEDIVDELEAIDAGEQQKTVSVWDGQLAAFIRALEANPEHLDAVGNGLQEAGWSNVEVQRLDWGAFLDKYSTGNEDDYNMYTLGWVDEFDPDGYLYYMFHPEVESETNGCYYRNEDVADKLTRARQSADREERNRLYTEATTTILEDRAHLPAYNLKNSFGVKEYVSDFTSHPVDSFHLVTDNNNVSVDK